jgi:hypothetical protein
MKVLLQHLREVFWPCIEKYWHGLCLKTKAIESNPWCGPDGLITFLI